MADEKKATQADVHIDEFLKGVEENDILKGMFRHFLVKVQGIEKKTADEFVKLFDSFKELPASELK